MNDKERCRMLIDEVRMLRAENADLKEELASSSFSLSHLIAELNSRWEKLRDIDDKEFVEVFHGAGMKRHCAQMMRIRKAMIGTVIHIKLWLLQNLEEQKKAMK